MHVVYFFYIAIYAKTDYLFDAAAMAHPGLVRVQWLDQISDTKVHTIVVKGKIQDVILYMLEDLHCKGGGSGCWGEGESSSTSKGRRYRTLAESSTPPPPLILCAVMSDGEDAVDGGVCPPDLGGMGQGEAGGVLALVLGRRRQSGRSEELDVGGPVELAAQVWEQHVPRRRSCLSRSPCHARGRSVKVKRHKMT